MTSLHSLSNDTLDGHQLKKRDCPSVAMSLLPFKEVDENLSPYPIPELRGDHDAARYPAQAQCKRHKVDNSCSVDPALQPIVLLHVRESPVLHNSPEKLPSSKLSTKFMGKQEVPGPASSDQKPSPAKKSYKNPNLNISIPPLPTSSKLGLELSSASANGDPVTPLYQIVHTPTTAPGAPGPGDPAEIRRLEQSWAANMANYGQLSPAFPNFLPPTFLDFPINEPSVPTLDSRTCLSGKTEISKDDVSSALKEMFALTAAERTPTFSPPQRTLSFGQSEECKALLN